VLAISSGGSTWLEGAASAYDTPWIALAPGGEHVAAVRIQEGRDNESGAGGLAVFDGSGAALTHVTPDGQLDFAPAWADLGRQVVFLRATADDVLPDEDTGWAPSSPRSSVVVYDLGTGASGIAAPPEAARGALLVPAVGHTAVYLQQDGGVLRTYGVDIGGGQPGPLEAGGDEHTAIGWAAP
jgi:hypothetical protein